MKVLTACFVTLALAGFAAETKAGDCCKKEQQPTAPSTASPAVPPTEPIFVPPPPRQAYGPAQTVPAHPGTAHHVPPAPYPVPVYAGQAGVGAAPRPYPGYPVPQPVFAPGYQPGYGYGPGYPPIGRTGQAPSGCGCRR